MDKKKVIILIIVLLLLVITGGVTTYLILNSNKGITESKLMSFQKYEDDDYYLAVEYNEKWGYINFEGIEKIEPQYDSVAEKFIKVKLDNGDLSISLAKQQDKYYVITKNNQKIEIDCKNDFTKFSNENEDIINRPEETKMLFFLIFLLDKIDISYDFDSEELLNSSLFFYVGDKQSIDIDYDKNFNCFLYKNKSYILKIQYHELEDDEMYFDYYVTKVSVIKGEEETTNNEFVPIYETNDGYEIKLYDDGYIPFCNLEESVQGWYDKEGNRIALNGKFEIINVRNNIVILKNFDKTNEFDNYIFIDFNNNILLQAKEVKILEDGYLIHDSSDKYGIYDDSINLISKEYDDVSSEIEENGLYDVNVYGKKNKVKNSIKNKNSLFEI